MSAYPMDMEGYGELVEAMDDKSEAFRRLFDAEVITSVSNLQEDEAYIAASESRTSRNDEWVKGVKKDLHLSEALNIMDDMIRLNANK
jgi:hypothetical protein